MKTDFQIPLILDGAMGTTLIDSAIRYSIDTILINYSTIDTTMRSIPYIKKYWPGN